MQTHIAPYSPRNPRLSDYYRCVEDYFEELERVHEERYQARLGYLRPEIRLTIFRYLDCGCLQNGFARVKCDDCGHEYLVALATQPEASAGSLGWLMLRHLKSPVRNLIRRIARSVAQTGRG